MLDRGRSPWPPPRKARTLSNLRRYLVNAAGTPDLTIPTFMFGPHSFKTSTELGVSVDGDRRGAPLARVWVCVMAVALCLGGCSRPAVTVKQMPSAIRSRRGSELDQSLLTALVGERENDAYRLGPGDTLLVAVYGHPELSIAPFVAGPVLGAQGNHPVGLLIDNDGSVQMPLIGRVEVGGQTSEQVQEQLEQQLAVYVKEPKVAVQLLFAGNIRYYLLGMFTNPGLKYSDRPLGLLEALSLGGSVDLEKASLRTAYIARKGKKLPID